MKSQEIKDKFVNKLKELKNNKRLLIAIVVVLLLIVAFIVSILFISSRKKESKINITLSYMSNDELVTINPGDTVLFPCGESNSVSVNNYSDIGSPFIEWSSEDESTAIIDGKAGRCYLSDDNLEKIMVTASGKEINDFSFFVEFVEKQLELNIKDTAWKVGNIEYYLLADGSFYLIYEGEKNYIKGKYNYVKVDEDTISENAVSEFGELFEAGVYYKIDVAVEEEYLANASYNSDKYAIYMYGDGENVAIYDEGWGLTKQAEVIEIVTTDELETYFDEARAIAGKKTSKKNLGNVLNRGWKSDGVNYYFYADGEFDSISVINNDYIKGTYVSSEIEPEEIDEELLEAFSELMVPKKYYKVTCNVNKEIYNGENISVTSLEMIIAQNGIKYAIYDSNWNQVSDAEQIELEARDDFDIFFSRAKFDVNEEFTGKTLECNGVKYHFNEDGSYLSEDEQYDTSVKGEYFAIDIYDDLLPQELARQIKSDEYYFVEIKVNKIWHERKDTVEDDIPACVCLIVTNNKDQLYIYDSYFGTYDDAYDITEGNNTENNAEE